MIEFIPVQYDKRNRPNRKRSLPWIILVTLTILLILLTVLYMGLDFNLCISQPQEEGRDFLDQVDKPTSNRLNGISGNLPAVFGMIKNFISNQPMIISNASLDREQLSNTTLKQVCYYWIPQNGSRGGNLTPRDLDPSLCTHIVISCAVIRNNTIVPLAATDIQVYKEVVKLKKLNPKLRVLLCLANGFSALVKDQNAVAIFAFNAHQFLVKYGFDGLDLDWEFPGWPVWQKDEREKKWFTHLVLQLNNALKLASHPPMMLTIAVGAPKSIVDSSYEVQELAKYVDFVSIMGYDYHMFQSYFPFTGHNAPLSKGLNEIGFWATMNIEWATDYWLEKGMPKEKLVVGIPTYGRTWKLLSRDWFNVGAPSVGVGMLNGVISYIETCIFIKEGATSYFDDYSQVPFAKRDRDWVSFENSKSIRLKAKWIKNKGVGGVMTWNLNCDDWAGLCNGKKFELHNIIKDIIRS